MVVDRVKYFFGKDDERVIKTFFGYAEFIEGAFILAFICLLGSINKIFC